MKNCKKTAFSPFSASAYFLEEHIDGAEHIDHPAKSAEPALPLAGRRLPDQAQPQQAGGEQIHRIPGAELPAAHGLVEAQRRQYRQKRPQGEHQGQAAVFRPPIPEKPHRPHNKHRVHGKKEEAIEQGEFHGQGRGEAGQSEQLQKVGQKIGKMELPVLALGKLRQIVVAKLQGIPKPGLVIGHHGPGNGQHRQNPRAKAPDRLPKTRPFPLPLPQEIDACRQQIHSGKGAAPHRQGEKGQTEVPAPRAQGPQGSHAQEEVQGLGLEPHPAAPGELRQIGGIGEEKAPEGAEMRRITFGMEAAKHADKSSHGPQGDEKVRRGTSKEPDKRKAAEAGKGRKREIIAPLVNRQLQPGVGSAVFDVDSAVEPVLGLQGITVIHILCKERAAGQGVIEQIAHSQQGEDKHQGLSVVPAGKYRIHRLPPKNHRICKKRCRLLQTCIFFGAANQIRTGDLILTKDVLCLLSHSSIMATRNGLEPSTSSVTG